MEILAWIFWDPNPDAFTLPFTNRTIRWYGIFFALGFILCYFTMIALLSRRLAKSKIPLESTPQKLAKMLIDRLSWYIFIGVVLGARLGNAFFYDWDYFKHHLLEIFAFWEPGLASHGAFVGIFIALYLYYRNNKKYFGDITALQFLDIFALGAIPACICIRLGNFVNQEILGSPSELPWAVIFGHPVDGSSPIPRHPVQLYEALAYLIIFVLNLTLWYFKRDRLKPGTYVGIALVSGFTARFLLEFFKTSQTHMIDESVVSMGQYLSLPFVLVGLYFLLRKAKDSPKSNVDISGRNGQ